MSGSYGELTVPKRILMGPGPSNVHPRVLAALAQPTIGHLDPAFLQIMNEVRELLQFLFQTRNPFTIAVSGTGSAGMETCFVNMLEPGDRALVCVNGVFGERMCDVAERCGAEVTRVEAEWGSVIDPEAVQKALQRRAHKLVALVHAETSTGVRQSVAEIARLAHEHGALVLLDAVTSLGGIAVELDEWNVDVCYSATQKCLSCPPGLSPVSFSARALDMLHLRRSKVQSWYLDMAMVERYWGQERFYHHTAPVNMIYALREALRLIHEEGLKERFERHWMNHHALEAGLHMLGIEMFAQEGRRLPMLNAVKVPEGIDEARARRRLLEEFGIEIGGGLGALKGKVWRIGLMGYSSTRENVLAVLNALERILADEGMKVQKDAAAQAATAIYTHD